MVIDADVRELLDEFEPEVGRLEGDWAAVVRSAGMAKRRAVAVFVIAVTVAVGILVATPALGLREEAVQLLGGGAPPQHVQTFISDLTDASGEPGQAFVDLRTSTGARVTLFAVRGPSDCLGVVWAGTRRLNGMAQCGETNAQRPFRMGESGHRVGGRWIKLVWGSVAPEVLQLELVSASGGVLAVPLSAGHFLVEVPRWPGDAHLVAYGAGQLELGRRKLESPPSWLPPDPLEPRRPLVVREFANRRWALYSYEAVGGRRCYGFESTRDTPHPPPYERQTSDSFRCVPELALADDAVSVLGPEPWPSLVGSGGVLSIAGVAGVSVHGVRLVGADGSHTKVPLVGGAFLHLAQDSGAVDRRPQALEALDDEGRILQHLSLR